MAARVSAEGAGPSYASVLNFRGAESNKENIEAAPGEVPEVVVRQVKEEPMGEEEEGFVPVIAHGRRPGKSRRERERRAPPRPHKAGPQHPSEAQPNPDQPQPEEDEQPKKFVEAPIPKVNPWQVRGGSTGVPPPAPPALEEKRSPLQPQQQGRAQPPPLPQPVVAPQPPEPVVVASVAPPKPAVVKAPKIPKVNQKMPSNVTEWKQVAKDFEDRWNFPHCLGAMDGKHVAITCPPHSGSQYYNYKQFFSIVLFAVTDARYNFLYVHAGVQGSISDGGVFRHTAFGKALLQQTLDIPQSEPLPGREMLAPYVFLADDAFPLMENICKPYTLDLKIGSPKRVCNYRISRARRIVENSFGIMSSVFRVLHTTIDVDLKHVQNIVMACTYLHNFLRRNTRAQSLYSPPGTYDSEDIDVGRIMPGSWRDEQSLTSLRTIGRNATTRAKAVRDEFMHYFMTEQGRVAWQDKYL